VTSPGVTARWQLWSEKSQVKICKLPQGFESDLVELRNQNALITDSLVCFPAGHAAGAPLVKELVHRSDVVDVLAGLPQLIDCGMRIADCEM
jgi:hypothetical protein